MPDRRSPTAAERSEALIRDTAQQAVALALAGTEHAQADAVKRALRDERVDRTLGDHEAHLQTINGSQERTAKALGELVATHKTQLAVTEALSDQLQSQGSKRYSRWMVIVGVLAGVGAYSGLIAAAIAH